MKNLIVALAVFFAIGLYSPAVKAEVTEVTAEQYCSAVLPALEATLNNKYNQEVAKEVMSSVNDWSDRLQVTVDAGLRVLTMYPMTVAMLGEDKAKNTIGYDRCVLEIKMSNVFEGKDPEDAYTGATDEQIAALNVLFSIITEEV